MGARLGIGGPKLRVREFFGEIFEDRQRFPDVDLASASAGIFPVGEIFATVRLNCGSFNEITCSANAMPATFMAIHGRNDHDE